MVPLWYRSATPHSSPRRRPTAQLADCSKGTTRSGVRSPQSPQAPPTQSRVSSWLRSLRYGGHVGVRRAGTDRRIPRQARLELRHDVHHGSADPGVRRQRGSRRGPDSVPSGARSRASNSATISNTRDARLELYALHHDGDRRGCFRQRTPQVREVTTPSQAPGRSYPPGSVVAAGRTSADTRRTRACSARRRDPRARTSPEATKRSGSS